MLTYADPDAHRLSLEMLVSSVVVLAQEWSFLDHLPAGSSSSPLMGLPGVDALLPGCQKVKVPYSLGTLQSLCRFEEYSIVTHLSLFVAGEQA